MKAVVIGGGAAGFFSAISIKKHHPTASVWLLEKSSKVLSKVRISGGGRCNVCHNEPDIRRLSSHYPRGERLMRKALHRFGFQETVAWFESSGVSLKTEGDGRMFPTTDQSATIVNALLQAAQSSGVQLGMNRPVRSIEPVPGGGFQLRIGEEEWFADKVIVATGGAFKSKDYQWLRDLGVACVEPVPSLFTFNIPLKPLHQLMGVSVEKAQVRLVGTKFQATGPVLITHWGLSGPAVLRVSAFAARYFAECDYCCEVSVNWVCQNENEVREWVAEMRSQHPNKLVLKSKVAAVPNRLWEFHLKRAGVDHGLIWGACPKKVMNKLINTLCNDTYEIEGKTTFKEEFVTAGGVDLQGIDHRTMESKAVPGLYFAGEVLDIDGVTGGFNFQAAWTTGYIAGMLS